MLRPTIAGLFVVVPLLATSGCSRPPQPPAAAPVAQEPKAQPPLFSVQVVGHGPPVLLLPGLASPGAVWDSTVAHLQDRYTLHVFTLAGFGGQPPRPGLTLDAVRQGILGYVAEQKLQKPVVIGHSLGGLLAYWLGASAPDRVGPLVSVDGLPFLPVLFAPGATVDGVRPQAEAFRSMFSAMGHEAYLQALQQGIGVQATGPEHQAQVLAWSSTSDPATVGNAMAEVMTTDLRPSMRDIRSPLLLLGAMGGVPAAQQAAVRAVYEEQVSSVPNHQVVFLEHSRHFVMLDDPAALFAALDAFLGRTRG